MADCNKAQPNTIINCDSFEMDKEAFEKLIEGQPKEIRGKGAVLFNASAECAAAYREDHSAANLRDWEAAQAALEKFVAQLGVATDEDSPLSTIADVLEYLKAGGWRVSKTSLHRHRNEGKIIPREDGRYHLRDVDKYARTFLRQASTGKRLSEKLDELQQKKAQLEIDNLELQRNRSRLAYEKEQGRFIPREQMEIELAMRAGILDAGLKHWVRAHTAGWIRLVDGNMDKVGELINKMSRDLDEHINNYAAKNDYEAVIDAGDEMIEDAEEEAEFFADAREPGKRDAGEAGAEYISEKGES
jgi:hypothetical protein